MSKLMTSKRVAMVDRLMNRYGVSPKEAHDALEEGDWNVWEAGLIITTRVVKATKEAVKDLSLLREGIRVQALNGTTTAAINSGR